MKITKLTYGKSFMINEGLWDKVGVEIEMSDTDDPEKARVLAKELVEDIFRRNNPEIPLASIQGQSQFPVIPMQEEIKSSEMDEEFEKAKEAINTFTSQEDALWFLNNPETIAYSFRYNIELKNLVNSKPKKQL